MIPDIQGRDVGRPVLRDETMPEGAWTFDEDVAVVFDDMLDRSIPQLEVMREAVSRIAADRLRDGDVLLDLGCSRGGAIAGVLDALTDRPEAPLVRPVGVEVSAPMRAAAIERFDGLESVRILDHDLRQGLPDVGPCGAILSVLTLQFTPIEHRLRLVDACHRALRPGGVLILVEKVLGASASLDATMVDLYYRRKREQGYSDEQIERKRLALEGVLVPVTARWNEELLSGSGFREVDCFWRWMNFAGWIAVRD